MKTRVITAVVGIAVLVLVMLTFNTLLFNLIVAAVALDRDARSVCRPRL